tara:strand:+ start:4226 stop:4498 length:273 start_codon:yes stop_codon:yes gene_type:complete
MNLAKHIATKVGGELREIRETYATKVELAEHKGIIKPTTSTNHPRQGNEPGDAYIEVDTGYMLVWLGNQWAEFRPHQILPPHEDHPHTTY